MAWRPVVASDPNILHAQKISPDKVRSSLKSEASSPESVNRRSKLSSIRRTGGLEGVEKESVEGELDVLPPFVSWGAELSMLVAGEFLFQYVRASAAQLLRTGYADSLGLVPVESAYLIELQLYMGTFFGIMVGWVSDAVSSQFIIMVTSLLLFSVVPIFCSIVSIPTVAPNVRGYILKILRYTFTVFTLAGGSRMAFLFSQDISVEKGLESSGFIFWCIWMRSFAELMHGLMALIPFESTYLLINGFAMSISSVIFIGAFFMMKSRLIQPVPYYKLVNGTLYYSIFSINFLFKKKLPPSEVNEVPSTLTIVSTYTELSGRRLGHLVLLLLPYIVYGSTNFLLEQVFLRQFTYLHAGKHFYIREHYYPLDGLFSATFLLLVRYLIYPLVNKTKIKYIKMTNLKSLIISYMFMGGALMWAYGMQTKIEKNYNLPSRDVAQVLIYNGVSNELSLNSSLFHSQMHPRTLFTAHVKTRHSLKTNLKYSYQVDNVREEKTEAIDIVQASSVSYVINEHGLRKLSGLDPIFIAPKGFNHPGKPVTFVVNIDESNRGDFNVLDAKTNHLEKVVEMEFEENRKYFDIDSGTYMLRFTEKNSTQYPHDVQLFIGGVYSFAVFSSPKLAIEMYNLIEPPVMAAYRLLPGMVMKSLSVAFGYVPLYEFTYSESPPHTTSILMSYALFVQTVGFGIPLWTQTMGYWHLLIDSSEILVHAYFFFISFIIFVALAIFIYKPQL